MWHEIKRYLSDFPDAVLTAHDADGYPSSTRTSVAADDTRQELHIQVVDEMELQPGPASLLFHDHDAQLWNQHVLLVRGELVVAPGGLVFRPLKLVPSMGYTGGLDMLRMLINCRKTARTYLQKRGLARPSLPWDKLKAIQPRS